MSKNNNKNNNLEEIVLCISNILDKKDFKVIEVNNNYELHINEKHLLKVSKTIKDYDKLKFNQLMDITAVDFPDKKDRFEMIYIFLSISLNCRLIIKFSIKEIQFGESKILKLSNQYIKKKVGWSPKLNINQTIDLTNTWYNNFFKNKKEIFQFTEKQIMEFFKIK